MIQYLIAFAVVILTIIFIPRVKWIMHAMPVISLYLTCTQLPIYPIYPQTFFTLIAAGQFATIFYCVFFTTTTLIQGAPFYIIAFIVFYWQVNRQDLFTDVNMKHCLGFGIVGFLNFLLMMSDVAYSVKQMFNTQHQVKKQAEDFEKILSTFPEGVIIAEVKKRASPYSDEERGGEVEVTPLFMNSEF